MFLVSAFLIGILGSMHCVGMCGPIAAVLPYRDSNNWRTAVNILLYHAGRIFMYALLGGLIGLMGKGVFLAGWQRGFSIGAGIALLLIAIFSLRAESWFTSLPVMRKVFGFVKSRMSTLLRKGERKSIAVVGMLNGLLPCGLVYLAITGAVATGDVWKGMAYMTLFGAGTIPLLMTASFAGALFPLKIRRTFRRAVPLLLVAFAILLISRAVQFDIPPGFSFWEATENQPMCHD